MSLFVFNSHRLIEDLKEKGFTEKETKKFKQVFQEIEKIKDESLPANKMELLSILDNSVERTVIYVLAVQWFFFLCLALMIIHR